MADLIYFLLRIGRVDNRSDGEHRRRPGAYVRKVAALSLRAGGQEDESTKAQEHGYKL